MPRYLLRSALLIFLSAAILPVFNPLCALAGEKVLYGSSAYALPTNVQEFVFSGFLLALRDYLSENEIKKLLIRDQRPGKSPMEAMEVIQDNLKWDPGIIFGFPSTHESQLVGPVVQSRNILTVFAATSNTNVRSMGNRVYSTNEDSKLSVRVFCGIIKEQYAGKRGLVLYLPEDYFSLNQKTVWDEVITENKLDGIDFFSIKDEGTYPELLKKIPGYDFIVITCFPTVAFDVMEFLQKNKKDLPTFTNSSWYKVKYEILNRILAQKKKELYIVDAWDRGTEKSRQFISKFRRTYNVTPGIEAAVGYDSGLILVELLKRQKNNPGIDFTQAFLSGLCFEGGPLGKFCFDKNGGFAHRELDLIKIVKGKRSVIRKIKG